MSRTRTPEKRFGLLIDTYANRVMLFSGRGRKAKRIEQKLLEIAAELQRRAPEQTFKVFTSDDFIRLESPMSRDAMVALFRETAQACECDLV